MPSFLEPQSKQNVPSPCEIQQLPLIYQVFFFPLLHALPIRTLYPIALVAASSHRDTVSGPEKRPCYPHRPDPPRPRRAPPGLRRMICPFARGPPRIRNHNRDSSWAGPEARHSNAGSWSLSAAPLCADHAARCRATISDLRGYGHADNNFLHDRG